MSASSPEHVVPFSIRWIPNPHPTTAAPHISITQLEEAVAAQHATNEEAMEKETMEKEPHLTQMRLALSCSSMLVKEAKTKTKSVSYTHLTLPTILLV